MDDDLFLFPYGPGCQATQRVLQAEARELYDDEPFCNASTHIQAYEREFRALQELQPRRILRKQHSPLPHQDIPTTPLPRLYS